MRRFPPMLIVAATLLLAGSVAAAEDRGAFVLTLGMDTTSVETYLRSPERLEVDQVGRAPRVLRRKFTYELTGGIAQKFSLVVTPPGADAPTQVIEAHRDGDSLRVSTRTGGNPAVPGAVFLPAGALLVAGSSPYAVYEGEIQKLVRSKSDTLSGQVYYIGAPNLERYRVKKLGRDSVEISVSRGDLWRARIDKTGHVLGARPLAGTFQVAISRPASLDMEAFATTYRAREQGGSSLGMLSPRDTVRTTLPNGGALFVDYGRPAKRGRVVFGGLVPYGEVWRTGANAATQLKLDRPIEIAGHAVAAGGYTLWTIPSAAGWKLVLNSETGQWGTAHDAQKDLFTTDMKMSALPQAAERFTITIEPTATGGLLHMDWDTTRASVEYTAKAE